MPHTTDAAMKIRLAKGEVIVGTEPVPGSNQPRLVVRAMFDVPPEAVWKHIEDATKYAEFMPRVKSVQVLSRDGNDLIRTKLTVDMPFPLKNLSATTRAKHTVEPGVRYVREWVLEEGDYHVNEGSWTLVPFDGDPNRALGVYRVHVVPKMPIPGVIQSAVQEKAMPKLIEALRARSKK